MTTFKWLVRLRILANLGLAVFALVWPAQKKGDKEKVEEFEVLAGTTYALKRKKEGGFAFEKVEAKK